MNSIDRSLRDGEDGGANVVAADTGAGCRVANHEAPAATSAGWHTPGPWTLLEHGGRYEVRALLACINGLSAWFTVARTAEDEAADGYTDGAFSPAADARLMAAAPELLAALRAADEALAQVTAFEDDARYIMGNTNFEIVKLRRQEVRAAIAKAEGRS